MGCPRCSGQGFTYLSFEDAKKFVRNLGIKDQSEYKKWWDENKPDFLPKNLDQYYKNNF